MAIVGVASVKVRPDLTEFRKELNAGLKAMDPTVTVKAHVDTSEAFRELLKFEQFSEKFHSVEIPVEMNRNNLAAVTRSLRKVDVDFKRIGVTGSKAFLGIAGTMATVNSGLNGASTAISAIVAASGALLIIPGILSAGGAALTTIALGADGVKKAFERLTPQLDKLKLAVSQSFERSLRPAVTDLQKILPGLRAGFVGVADAIGDTGKSFTTMLRAPDNMRTLNSVLSSTEKITRDVGKAASPLGRAFLDVADVGAKVFGGLTSEIESVSNEFATMIRQAKESGKLDKLIRGGIDAFKDFFDVLTDIGAIVSDVFSALREGGGSVGAVLAPAIKTVKDFVASAQGQETFRLLGEALAKVGDAVSRILGPALEAIGPLIGPIADLIGDVAQILADALGPALKTLGQIAKPLVTALKPFVEQIVRALVPILPVVVASFGQLASVAILLTPILMGLTIPIQLAIAGLTAMAQVMRGDFTGAAETMKTGFANASASMKTITETDWAGMAADVQNATSDIQIDTENASVSMKQDWGDGLNGMRGDTTSSMSGILGSIRGQIPQVPGIVGGAADNAEREWGDGLNGMRNKAQSGIGEIVGVVASLPGRVLGAIGDLSGLLIRSGVSLVNGFLSGLRSKIGEVASVAANLVQAARNFFPFSPAKEGPFSGRGWVLYSGRSTAEAFAQGIAQRSDVAVRATEQMMRAVSAVPEPNLSTGFSGLGTGFASGDQSLQSSFDVQPAPVTIVVEGDEAGLRQFMKFEIREDGRRTRSKIRSGVGG